MKIRLISSAILLLTFNGYAQAILPDMGRTTQTLNQMDKSQDGVLSRNQGYHEETDKPSLNESYNDEAHREYVRKRKAMKKKEAKQF